MGNERIGWTRDHRIGFTGFVDVNTAGAAAWIAHVALARRRDRTSGVVPAMSDVPSLSVSRTRDGEWVWGGSRALARLIRPGTPTAAIDGVNIDNARHGWWSIEVELPALASELDVTSAAYVIHRGLLGSGLAWEARDAFRDRAHVSNAWEAASAARTQPTVERSATNRLREWRRQFAFAWRRSAVARALHLSRSVPVGGAGQHTLERS